MADSNYDDVANLLQMPFRSAVLIALRDSDPSGRELLNLELVVAPVAQCARVSPKNLVLIVLNLSRFGETLE